MGIFSFFSRDDEDDEELLWETEQQPRQAPSSPEAAPTGELYEGMHLDVMTREGDPLLSGRVRVCSPDSLVLCWRLAEMSL